MFHHNMDIQTDGYIHTLKKENAQEAYVADQTDLQAAEKEGLGDLDRKQQ